MLRKCMHSHICNIILVCGLAIGALIKSLGNPELRLVVTVAICAYAMLDGYLVSKNEEVSMSARVRSMSDYVCYLIKGCVAFGLAAFNLTGYSILMNVVIAVACLYVISTVFYMIKDNASIKKSR